MYEYRYRTNVNDFLQLMDERVTDDSCLYKTIVHSVPGIKIFIRIPTS